MLVQHRKGWANINPASVKRQGRIQGGAQGARAPPLISIVVTNNFIYNYSTSVRHAGVWDASLAPLTD